MKIANDFSFLFHNLTHKKAPGRSQALVDILLTDTILTYYEWEMWECRNLFENNNYNLLSCYKTKSIIYSPYLYLYKYQIIHTEPQDFL
jgi:hypothetical protein